MTYYILCIITVWPSYFSFSINTQPILFTKAALLSHLPLECNAHSLALAHLCICPQSCRCWSWHDISAAHQMYDVRDHWWIAEEDHCTIKWLNISGSLLAYMEGTHITTVVWSSEYRVPQSTSHTTLQGAYTGMWRVFRNLLPHISAWTDQWAFSLPELSQLHNYIVCRYQYTSTA